MDKNHQPIGQGAGSGADHGQTDRAVERKIPDMTIEDAYQVQVAMLSHRLSRGARVIGKKSA